MRHSGFARLGWREPGRMTLCLGETTYCHAIRCMKLEQQRRAIASVSSHATLMESNIVLA